LALAAVLFGFRIGSKPQSQRELPCSVINPAADCNSARWFSKRLKMSIL